MLKRKDWQLFQGQDGSGSDSESTSDEEQDAVPSGSESESASSQGGLSGGEGEEGAVRRIEDLSEDDFEPDGDGVDVEATALKEQWLTATKEEASKLPRAALSCRLCKGVLMLGPASLRQHLESNKHLARLKRKAEGFEPVFLSMGAQDDSDMETHQERLERLKAAAASPPVDGKPPRKKKSSKAKKAKELKAGGILKRAGKGKPGKRQRAELKAADPIDRKSSGKGKRPPKPAAIDGVPQPGKGAMNDAPPGKSSFWSSPAKKGGAGSGGVKGGVKKSKMKKPSEETGGNANRAERRRVKQERMKVAK